MWDWDCFLNHNNSSENGMFLTNIGSPFHKSQVGWHLTFVPPALLKIIHWVMVHWSLCSFWSLILSNFSHSFHLKSFSNSIQSWVQCPKLCKNVDKKKQRVTSFGLGLFHGDHLTISYIKSNLCLSYPSHCLQMSVTSLSRQTLITN